MRFLLLALAAMGSSVLAIDPDEYLQCATDIGPDGAFIPDDAATKSLCAALKGKVNTLDKWAHCTGRDDFYSNWQKYADLCVGYGAEGAQGCPPIGPDPNNPPTCSSGPGKKGSKKKHGH